LPRLAALRGKAYRDQRLELAGVNANQQPQVNIEEWQDGIGEDGKSAGSEESWTAKEDQTSVTESTLPEEMDEHIKQAQETEEELRRRRLTLAQGKTGMD
jgi:hypothetical protein